MRTIKFRGKNIETGEWVYVDLIQRMVYMPSIMFPYESDGKVRYAECAVKRETIGQFTGLQDKNGIEIYEGDIVKGCWNSVFTIVWENHSTSFQARVNDGYQREISYFGLDKLEVIGNIYDNPELLKGE